MRALAVLIVLGLARTVAGADTPSAADLLGRGLYRDALAAARSAISADPKDADAALIAARASLALEDPDQAEHYFRRAARLAPTRPGIHVEIGAIAIARATEAVAKHRDFEVAPALRAAVKSYEAELELAPGSVVAARGRATALVGLGDLPAAIVALEELRKLAPADPAPCVALASQYAVAGRWEDVAKLPAAYSGGDPTAVRAVVRAAAHALLLGGRTSDADPLLSRLDTSDAPPGDLALLAARAGDETRAIESLARHAESGAAAGEVKAVRRIVCDLLVTRSLETAGTVYRSTPAPPGTRASAVIVRTTLETETTTDEDLELPTLVRKAEPRYPEALRRQGRTGSVTLLCVILRDGTTVPVRVMAVDDRDFVSAAVEAVREWRYSPAVLNGHPVMVWSEVRVTFKRL